MTMTTNPDRLAYEAQRALRIRRTLIVMSILMGLGAFLAGVTYSFIHDRTPRIVCFAVAFFLAALGAVLIFRTVREELAIRRWSRWCCPSCKQNYDVREYREATLWVSYKGQAPTSGVMLTCTNCDTITSFSNSGKAVDSHGDDDTQSTGGQ